MKMWFSPRIFRCFLSTSIRSIPTVRVLLKRGESPVVSVSITNLFIVRNIGLGLYGLLFETAL